MRHCVARDSLRARYMDAGNSEGARPLNRACALAGVHKSVKRRMSSFLLGIVVYAGDQSYRNVADLDLESVHVVQYARGIP